MLYVVIGNVIVFVLSLLNGVDAFEWLCFDKTSILRGEVWRLITYVFTETQSPLGIIFLYFFYSIGRHVEQTMGTFKFNLYYFTGLILMDAFAMIFSPVIPEVIQTQEELTYLQHTISAYYDMGYYLHLSLLLTFATLHPDTQIYIFLVLPIKASYFALIYGILVAVEIFNLSFPVFYFPHNLFPLVGVSNYLLFLGSDIQRMLPAKWRKNRRKAAPRPDAEPIQFRPVQRPAPKAEDFSHKCTICGRTDITNPELEFRYCSRCNGYHCYCQDHINDHTHV